MRELKNTYQLWFPIIFFSAVLTVTASFFLIKYTWGLGTNWGSFIEHFDVISLILKDVLTFELSSFYQYKNYIIESNYTFKWLLHILIPLFICLFLSMLIVFKWLWVKGGIDKAIHIRGSRLIKGRFAIKHARKHFKKELKKSTCGGLKLHPEITISETQEAGNILATGAQGSGKSTVIKAGLNQLLERGDQAVIYDAKQEYTELFLTKKNFLINPTDKRSICWDIMQDVQTPEQARQIASSLIPDNTKEPFWSNGAKEILTGCFIILLNKDGTWSWADLKKVLELSFTDLKEQLKWFHPKAAHLIEEDSKTTQGFISIISTELNWIDYVADVWSTQSTKKFSIRRWVNGAYNMQGLIIANDPRYAAISKPLCNVVLAILTDELLSFADSDKIKIWLVLDELADLPKTKYLEKWLSLGRSKGARTLAGTQNISQLQSIYGDKNTETITSLFSNIVALKVGNSAETARKIAENFGKRLVKRATINFDSEGKKSTSFSQGEEYVVRPEELMQLPSADRKGVKGYLSIQGWEAVYELVWPYFKNEKVAQAHVPVQLNQKHEETETKKLKRGSRGRNRAC
jgi:type IV secretory pathway TraG/TraD family ATPase VirD4